jgi:hypothetical protein
MNVLEEHEEEDLPALYPQHLLARINKWHHADMETESDECFDIRVDKGSDLDSPPKSDKATEVKTKVSISHLFHQVGICDLHCFSVYKVYQGCRSSGASV